MLPAEIEAETLAIVGDFNAWNRTSHPMKRRKDGAWARTLRLAPGVHHYRYLADDAIWYNDWSADRYEPSGLGEDNSVIELVVEA